MSKTKIKVGIVGIGNCAKSLVEGIQYYNENPDDIVGLMYPDIGGYQAKDIEFVIGFDVDRRKVNKPLAEALRADPNCAMNHVASIDDTSNGFGCIKPGAMVYSGPEYDGIAPHMLDYPEEVSFRTGAEGHLAFDEIKELLIAADVDVVINYLPVGSERASEYYMDAAIKAGCHFVNCIPTLISTKQTQRVEQKFIDAGLTIVGSDLSLIHI